jgi:23S rRNA pseudouridine2605 synthase
MPMQRIQKFLAAAGFGSRRACEELVMDGRVSVNGEPVRELPILIDPQKDTVSVDGKATAAEQHVYYMLNKPGGVFCTQNDPAGRVRAVDLLRGVRERIFPVGRLEADSLGLLIMTNDGALAQKLTHPRFGVPKTYRAEISGVPADAVLEKMRSGIWLSEGRTAPAQVSIVMRQKDRSILEITLRESRNREIRRMLAKLGHNVRRLVRVRIGKLSIQKLPVGAFRKLAPEEIKYLHTMTEKVPAELPGRSGAPPFRAPRPGSRIKSRPRVGDDRRSSSASGANPVRRGDAPARKRRILLPERSSSTAKRGGRSRR